MPSKGKCDDCDAIIGEKELLFQCASCDFKCHAKCDKRFFEVKDRIAPITYQHFEKMGFRWFCSKCTSGGENSSSQAERGVMREMRNLCERVGNIEKLLSPSEKITSYASIVKNDSEKAIVITRKDGGKSTKSLTMAKIIAEKFDPKNAKLSDFRILPNDKCVLKTKSGDITKIKEQIMNIDDKFEVNPLHQKKPRLKLVTKVDPALFGGEEAPHIPTDDETNEMIDFMKTQNDFIGVDDEIKIVHRKLNERKSCGELIIETEPSVHKAFLKARHVMIGFERYSVYDANTVPRCYKCSGLFHFERNCKSSHVCCPKCAGSHRLKECTSQVEKCINCVTANERSSNPKHRKDVNHAAYDHKCPMLANRTRRFFV